MKKLIKTIPPLLVLLLAVTARAPAAAQDGTTLISYKGNGSYMLVEKSDLRRYDNDKYTGLQSREVQSFIRQTEGSSAEAGSLFYDGSFFVVQETKRNTRAVRQGISTSIPSSFKITADGNLVMLEDNGYPSFRSFPAYPRQRIAIGDSWQCHGERAVDPLGNGQISRMPMLVEYTYLRDDSYNGSPVYVLKAQWATRYGVSYIDPEGDPELKSAQGKHDATILVSKESGNAIVVRDIVDEYFVYEDGRKVALKGTISLFTKYPPAYDRGKLVHALQRAAIVSPEKAQELARADGAGSSGKNGSRQPAASSSSSAGGSKAAAQAALSGKGLAIAVDNTADGIRLTMQNLQFKPDSAELLPAEQARLDALVGVLKEAPESRFLVEGHTASTGNPDGELRLSVERARAVAEALVRRGIPAEQFICTGCGGTRPLADNSTPEGMARNRRVEITILE